MNAPGTFAVAFNCAPPSGVPYGTVDGAFQVIAGVPFATSIDTLVAAVLYVAPSVGVKTTESVCPLPAGSTLPTSGVYASVPGTFAVAFSCVPSSTVP